MMTTALTPAHTDLYCKCLISYDTAVSRARHPDRIIPQKT